MARSVTCHKKSFSAFCILDSLEATQLISNTGLLILFYCWEAIVVTVR